MSLIIGNQCKPGSKYGISDLGSRFVYSLQSSSSQKRSGGLPEISALLVDSICLLIYHLGILTHAHRIKYLEYINGSKRESSVTPCRLTIDKDQSVHRDQAGDCSVRPRALQVETQVDGQDVHIVILHGYQYLSGPGDFAADSPPSYIKRGRKQYCAHKWL